MITSHKTHTNTPGYAGRSVSPPLAMSISGRQRATCPRLRLTIIWVRGASLPAVRPTTTQTAFPLPGCHQPYIGSPLIASSLAPDRVRRGRPSAPTCTPTAAPPLLILHTLYAFIHVQTRRQSCERCVRQERSTHIALLRSRRHNQIRSGAKRSLFVMDDEICV